MKQTHISIVIIIIIICGTLTTSITAEKLGSDDKDHYLTLNISNHEEDELRIPITDNQYHQIRKELNSLYNTPESKTINPIKVNYQNIIDILTEQNFLPEPYLDKINNFSYQSTNYPTLSRPNDRILVWTKLNISGKFALYSTPGSVLITILNNMDEKAENLYYFVLGLILTAYYIYEDNPTILSLLHSLFAPIESLNLLIRGIRHLFTDTFRTLYYPLHMFNKNKNTHLLSNIVVDSEFEISTYNPIFGIHFYNNTEHKPTIFGFNGFRIRLDDENTHFIGRSLMVRWEW
jgi:hypothetical protein